MAENDAKALLQRIEDSGNKNRVIYIRFKMTVVHIEPLHKSGDSTKTKYVQDGVSNERGMRLDARLDSVEFYEDAAMTKLIYSHTP